MFKVTLLHNYLLPFKRMCDLAVRVSDPVDSLAHLTRGSETRCSQSLTPQYAEPDLDLIEPRSMSRREVKAYVGMPHEPPIFLGLVGVQIIQDHVKLHIVWIDGDAFVH